MEIERKYLCQKVPENLEIYDCICIVQGYISVDPVIRIRKANEDYFLTVKGKGEIAREEFELILTKEQFETLSKKIELPFLNKKRYLIPLECGLTAELDIYEGFLDGLVTVEVEFETSEQEKKFVPPHWFSKDVSTDNQYKNATLCLYGIPT